MIEAIRSNSSTCGYAVHALTDGDWVVSAGLLWRVARVDLAPEEAVDLILGVPRPKRGLSPGAARDAISSSRWHLQDAACWHSVCRPALLRKCVDTPLWPYRRRDFDPAAP